jgi:hypothetical protein
LYPLISSHLNSDPPAKGIRPCAKIHGYIKDFTAYNSYEFPLSFGWELQMKTPQHPMCRADKVVLEECAIDHGERASSVRFGEVPAFIHVAWRSDQDDVGDVERCEI